MLVKWSQTQILICRELYALYAADMEWKINQRRQTIKSAGDLSLADSFWHLRAANICLVTCAQTYQLRAMHKSNKLITYASLACAAIKCNFVLAYTDTHNLTRYSLIVF